MKRVVVTGSECTGKTTLARALAAHYETAWVPEYARQFVLEKGAAPDHTDVTTIARGQIDLEQTIAANRPRLLIQDTDLLSTAIYSRHYYGDCPIWIEEAVRQRAPDLYLLADIDVPWVPDGEQRDRGDRREEMQALFRHELISNEFEFVEVSGSLACRMRGSISAIDLLLAG